MSVNLTGESMRKKESSYEYGFFKLENNHDTAIVRLLHENYNDFSRRPVHAVKIPGNRWRRNVNCLRDDNQPIETCPFCGPNLNEDAISKRRKRIYVEFLVYQIKDRNGNIIADYSSAPKRMVWDKERAFDDKMFSLSARCNPLHSGVFAVERIGEVGYRQTTYDIYAVTGDETTHPYTLPEKTYNPDNIQVLCRNFDEMNYYLENGDFPPRDTESKSEPVRQRRDVETVQTQNTSQDQVRQEPVQPAAPQPALAQQTQTTQPVYQTRRSI